METTIISQIAKELFYKNTKIPEELKRSTAISINVDRLSLSESGKKFQANDSTNSNEAQRSFEVERIKESISHDNYVVDQKVIEDIAEKIAKMFI